MAKRKAKAKGKPGRKVRPPGWTSPINPTRARQLRLSSKPKRRQRDVAQELDIDVGDLSRLENGHREPFTSLFKRYCEVLAGDRYSRADVAAYLFGWISSIKPRE